MTQYKRWLILCVFMLCVLTTAARANAGINPNFPETGDNLLRSGHVTVDVSNAESGYILAKHSGTSKRLKIVITHPSGENRYDLNNCGQFETFPLSYGNGVYKIAVYEQAPSASEDMYQKVFSERITVTMPDENSSFLYPNQYVWYTESSLALSKSIELCRGLTGDMEKVEAVYSYIREKIQYDYAKTLNVKPVYLPDVDQTIMEEAGICFDNAALFACMLRVQGIPTQLAIGELLISDPPVTHAWNRVRIGDVWLLIDLAYDKARYDQTRYVQNYAY